MVKLRAAKERTAQGCYIIEGELELSRALAAGVKLRELFVCPEHWRDTASANQLVAEAEKRQAKVSEATREVFAKISLREGPDGLLGVADLSSHTLDALTLPDRPLVVVVEKIEKPGNLGALIRTAEAVGAHALIACDPVADFENPQVIRNSRGLVFALSCVAAEQAQVDAFLAEHGIRVAATTPDTDLAHWDADLTGPLAVMAGAEHDGLSDYWLHRAEIKIRIPMQGQADSLNVNTAAAIVLFEALRQRT
nr:RNA methyltransferase [Cerasicoccus arenae]